MHPTLLLDTFSPFLVFLIFFLLMLLFFEGGFKIGKWRKRLRANEDKSAEPMIGGVLGLLAFVLAFSFNIAANRYELRKQNVVSDANAVSTAFLRADLVPEPQRSVIKSRLIAYAGLRADTENLRDLESLRSRLEALQISMWKTLASISPKERTAVFNALASALNTVYDIHEKRLNDALYNRMGNKVWFIIFTITFLSTFMLGVRAGFSEKKSYVTLIPFTLALTLMVYLVTDLDSPQSGLFRVSQQPMLDTLAAIRQYDSAPAALQAP